MAGSSSRNSFLIVVLHLIFMAPVLIWASYPLRRFVHVPIKMTWFDAQRYCREHHADLATFRSHADSSGLDVPCIFHSRCWIGLNRVNTKEWSWSSEEDVTFTLWNSHSKHREDPTNNSCAALGGFYWHSHYCLETLEFLCYDSLVLVKLNKTWEGALEHCLTLDTDPESGKSFFHTRYYNFGGDTSDARRVALHAQTEEVWVGLRFLAGHWLWVNGAPLQEQLPVCPRPGSHCGAMSKTGQLLPERDCEERRNFLCATRKYRA